jgi:hypothetical protein
MLTWSPSDRYYDKFLDSGLPWEMLRVRGQHSVSVDIRRAAEVRGSLQLTLSQISRLETLRGRRRMESPNPREFVRYQCTKVHWWQCEDTWIEAPAVS